MLYSTKLTKKKLVFIFIVRGARRSSFVDSILSLVAPPYYLPKGAFLRALEGIEISTRGSRMSDAWEQKLRQERG